MASVMVGNGHTDLSSQIVHPSWFKPELFLQPDFSPQAYIASVRKYVGDMMCITTCAPDPWQCITHVSGLWYTHRYH